MSRQTSTAIYLSPGDVFDFGILPADLDDAITVEDVGLTDSGLVRIQGILDAGPAKSYRCIWAVEFTAPVEFIRTRLIPQEDPRA